MVSESKKLTSSCTWCCLGNTLAELLVLRICKTRLNFLSFLVRHNFLCWEVVYNLHAEFLFLCLAQGLPWALGSSRLWRWLLNSGMIEYSLSRRVREPQHSFLEGTDFTEQSKEMIFLLSLKPYSENVVLEAFNER